jgi:predicted AAA+ superfamily ATPase
MAGSFLYKTPEAKYDYISDVFSTLIVRDIQKKYKIRNMQLMDHLCDFLIDNISNLTSTRSVAATFTKEQFKTNDRTISAYIKYLCNAFAFYRSGGMTFRGSATLHPMINTISATIPSNTLVSAQRTPIMQADGKHRCH